MLTFFLGNLYVHPKILFFTSPLNPRSYSLSNYIFKKVFFVFPKQENIFGFLFLF